MNDVQSTEFACKLWDFPRDIKGFAAASLFVSDAHILCAVESTIFEIMLTASTDKQWTQP